MKLVDVIIISLAVVFVIIAIHLTMTTGIGNSYWAIMLAFVLFFVFNFRKRK